VPVIAVLLKLLFKVTCYFGCFLMCILFSPSGECYLNLLPYDPYCSLVEWSLKRSRALELLALLLEMTWSLTKSCGRKIESADADAKISASSDTVAEIQRIISLLGLPFR